MLLPSEMLGVAACHRFDSGEQRNHLLSVQSCVIELP